MCNFILLGVFLGSPILTLAYFDFQIYGIQQLNGVELMDYTDLKVRKVNGTRQIFGKTIVHEIIDNSHMIEVTGYKKIGGKYQLLPYKPISKGSCDFYNEDEYFYEELAASSDYSYPYPCPLLKGTYMYHGYKPSLEKVPSSIIPSGDYAMELAVLKDEKELFRFRVYGSVVQL